MNPMTGVSLLRATAWSEDTGEEGEMEGLPSTSRSGFHVRSCVCRTAMSKSKA
ncbi:hypothetical protein RLOC_00012741 [Lonchura striata]|uniref:Uncharacterized protein n=1 Tax=Lonchura striata TaxID=40157 RepID=A0A218UCJ6_9PASE|nr:hypothetical protein RLOC_00012741 [Lonchura striata domestica]